MKKLFLDSDVLLDLLLDRPPFSEDIASLIEGAIHADVALFTSPVSITNIHYIIGKIENRTKANQKIKKVLNLVRIENMGQSVIDRAAASKFKDFEDAVQHFCALEAGHQILITRNTKDYKAAEISVMNPKECLAKMRMGLA